MFTYEILKQQPAKRLTVSASGPIPSGSGNEYTYLGTFLVAWQPRQVLHPVVTESASEIELLTLAGGVYEGLTDSEIADVESIALDRSRWSPTDDR